MGGLGLAPRKIFQGNTLKNVGKRLSTEYTAFLFIVDVHAEKLRQTLLFLVACIYKLTYNTAVSQFVKHTTRNRKSWHSLRIFRALIFLQVCINGWKIVCQIPPVVWAFFQLDFYISPHPYPIQLSGGMCLGHTDQSLLQVNWGPHMGLVQCSNFL